MEEKKDVALDTIPKIFMDAVSHRRSKTFKKKKKAAKLISSCTMMRNPRTFYVWSSISTKDLMIV